MNYLRIFILSLLLGLSRFGIAQTADVTKGCVPLTVNFQGPGGLSNYYWDFKDGVTSNKRNPANIFNKEGTYNVTLQETPTGPVIATIQIQVYPTPVLSATTTSGCAPVNVTLKSTSVINSAITVSNYTWVFGDGNSASSGISTSTVHNYASPGTYDLSLGIQTNFPSCDQIQILSQKVTTFAPPVASFTSNPSNTITCKDTLDVKFTSTSTFSGNLSYAWNFGNGKTSTSATPSSQRYFSGNYNTSLTVKSNPALAGCISSATQAISVGRPPITIGLLKDTICIYDFAVVGTKTPGIYSWSTDPNGTVLQVDSDGDGDYPGDEDDTITTINDPSVYNLLDTVAISFKTPGYHTIILKVTTPDGQCTDVDSVKVYVDQVTASITPSGDIYTCQSPLNTSFQAVSNQNNISYEWDLSRNNPPYKGVNYLYYVGSNKIIADTIKDVNSINYTFYSAYDSLYYTKNDQESFSVGLTITSKVTGCFATANKVVNMWLPNAEFRVDVSRGCAPLKVTFKDTSSVDKFPWGNSITSWKWIFDDGQEQLNSSNASIQHTYTSAGVYYARLVITTAQGCSDTSYAIPIRVGDAVNSVDFIADKTSVCVGEEVQLSVVNPSSLVSGYHFVTDNNRVFHCAGDQTVTWAYDDSIGTQDVSLVMDYNGCLSTITKKDYITVNGAVAKMDYYALCSSPFEYNFKSQSLGATSLSWDFGDGQTSTTSAIAHTYASSGTYGVTLTATGSGCPSSIASATINVKSVKAKMKIDSLLCINVPYQFDASQSVDVNTSCSSGYTWEFSNIKNATVFIYEAFGPLVIDTSVTFTGTNNIRPFTTRNSSTKFQFGDPGVHEVSLITTDVNGCTDTVTASFKVYDMTVPAPVTDKTDICTPSLVTFKDNSIGDTTLVKWEWFLGDGTDTIDFNNNSFAHSYIQPASNNSYYPLTLYVTDALGCQESVYSQINYYKPVSQIIASKLNLCLGDSVSLSAPDFTSKGSSLAFAWDLGNGQTSTKSSLDPIKYPAGDYTVKLLYTEIATGCKDSTEAIVSVQNYPVARIATNVDTIAQLCAPLQITFYDSTQSSSAIFSRSWDFGNGHQTSDLSESWTYDKGTYKVTLIDQTSYGCADTATRVLSLARPEGNFTMDKNQICRYEEITFKMKDTIDVTSWRWSFGDGNTLDNVDSVSHTYDFHPPGGSTLARLVLYKGSCANNPALEQPVYIYEVIADFTRQDDSDLDTTVCFNPDPTFRFTNTSTGFDNYAWFFGDGSGSSDYNPTHSYASKGTYDVTLAVDNGQCKDTTVKQVIVYPNPKLKAIGDTVCVGNKLYPHVINPSATSAYLWEPSTGLSDATSPNPEASLLHTTDFTLTETDLHGCKGDTLIKAIVIENLLSNWDTTIVIGDEIALPAYGTPIYMFAWTPNTGLSCTDCDYPKVQPLKDVTYNLTVTDVLNCFTSEYTYNVHVRPETFIKMPSAFSPNGDGNNDVLFVKGWGIKKLISFEVFNRWGQLLFTTSDLMQGWDGKFKGTVQNEDVYVYKVLATDWNEKELYTEGYFNLLH